MSLIAWNCRGLGSSSTIRAVKDVVSASRPAIVGLIETKATKKRCEEVRLKLGFRCCFCVPARGRSGGLALFWKDESEKKVIERMEDLRPISLTTVVSRVVAKAIVNRLQLILPEGIDHRFVGKAYIRPWSCFRLDVKDEVQENGFGQLLIQAITV
ncbi:hypothetical protein QQ045_012243 [Rhodiola kirilowii]